MSNPLVDTLFRPTTPPPARLGSVPDPAGSPSVASAAPVRERGTRSRAGNAMNRTRAALLAGAATAVETHGTRIAMAQVAAAAGVAKATLYNHFRTRDAVLAALVVERVQALVAAQEGKPLEAALTDAANALAADRALRGLARVEPATLAVLGRVDDAAPGWQLARAGVTDLLAGAGRGGVDTVLRWLASYLITPAEPDAIAADVAVLLAGLPVLDPAGATTV